MIADIQSTQINPSEKREIGDEVSCLVIVWYGFLGNNFMQAVWSLSTAKPGNGVEQLRDDNTDT